LANYEVGTYVSASSPEPLTTVVAIDPIKVVFQVGQDDYLGLISQSLKDPSQAAENQKRDESEGMRILLSDGTVYPQKGVFRAANNQISTVTGAITVEGTFPNPGTLLRPGLFARVQTTIGVQKNAIVVPLDALITIQNLHQLAVVGADNKVSIRNVKVGISTRSEVVILSGVSEGEQIVVQGIQKVVDGCTVIPLPASSSASASTTTGENGSTMKIPAASPTPTK
jgi:membrane fusion protein (multidrug efflux system)